jgi:hypothetical protein
MGLLMLKGHRVKD